MAREAPPSQIFHGGDSGGGLNMNIPARSTVQSGPSSDQRWMGGAFPMGNTLQQGAMMGGTRESVSAPTGYGGGRSPNGTSVSKSRGSYSNLARGSTAMSSGSQTGLPNLFRNSELRLLRPGAAVEAGFLEVYPRCGKKKPYLLEQLELYLEGKLRMSDKIVNSKERFAGSPTGELKRAGLHHAAKNMRLDAHRQCFELFINAFSTYRPLLQRIKEQYDEALNGALRSEQDNIQLRSDLVHLEAIRLKSVEGARQDAAVAASQQRGELARRLAEAESRASKAEATERKVTKDAQDTRAIAEKAMIEVKTLREANLALQARMLQESSFASRVHADIVSDVVVNPRDDTFGDPSTPTPGDEVEHHNDHVEEEEEEEEPPEQETE